MFPDLFFDVSNSNFLGSVHQSQCVLCRDRGELSKVTGRCQGAHLRRPTEIGATDSKTREPHTSSANKKQASWLIYLRDGKGLIDYTTLCDKL